jgi:peptidoglycan/LPS O-acetylase OafA/YrhL
MMAVSTIVTLSLAALSWHGIEQPALRLKARSSHVPAPWPISALTPLRQHAPDAQGLGGAWVSASAAAGAAARRR